MRTVLHQPQPLVQLESSWSLVIMVSSNKTCLWLSPYGSEIYLQKIEQQFAEWNDVCHSIEMRLSDAMLSLNTFRSYVKLLAWNGTRDARRSWSWWTVRGECISQYMWMMCFWLEMKVICSGSRRRWRQVSQSRLTVLMLIGAFGSQQLDWFSLCQQAVRLRHDGFIQPYFSAGSNIFIP